MRSERFLDCADIIMDSRAKNLSEHAAWARIAARFTAVEIQQAIDFVRKFCS